MKFVHSVGVSGRRGRGAASGTGRLAAAVTVVTVVGAAASAAFGAPPSGDFELVFADEFNSSTLDGLKWLPQYPWGPTHNHEAYASAENLLFTGDGALTLRAKRVAQGGKPFTTGVISTGYSKFRYNGGYAEARILLPNTVGSWPAFWGLDNGWPPEADIMEYPLSTNGGSSGYLNDAYHTAFHYRNTSGGNSAGAGKVNPGSVGDLRGAYHTFGMNWVEDDRVDFYFDGALVSSFGDNAAIAQMTSMYLIMNYAVGGWPGSPSLAQWPDGHFDDTKVDYIRVYQARPAGSSSTSTWNSAAGTGWDTAGNWSGIVPKFGDQAVVFPRIAGDASSAITWGGNAYRAVGSVTFTGDATGTTAYTLGSAGYGLQMANGAGASITAAASSTVSQTIAAQVDLQNATTVANNMTNGSTVTFTGPIVGHSPLLIDGPGTVVVSAAGTFTGGTTIDAGAAGPAVLRVMASNALGTGAVVIGPVGNDTTARLEIYGTRTLPNAIDLRGRNNSTVAIQGLRGDNTLAGTVSLNVGGGAYRIQADAGGTLRLTAATAITSAAGGDRVVTLQGGGGGTVVGAIVNGSATLGIAKEGVGTWALTGANTYTGKTSVSAGTLRLGKDAWAPVLAGAGGADVTGGKLVFDYAGAASPAAQVWSRIASGAIRHPAADAGVTLGYRDDGVSTVLVAPASYGDLDMDGAVDADDYLAIDRGMAMGLTGWSNGDVDYSGTVDAGDYLLMDSRYAQLQGPLSAAFLATREAQFGAAYVASLVAAVPEPASLGLVGAAAALAVAGGRRRAGGHGQPGGGR